MLSLDYAKNHAKTIYSTLDDDSFMLLHDRIIETLSYKRVRFEMEGQLINLPMIFSISLILSMPESSKIRVVCDSTGDTYWPKQYTGHRRSFTDIYSMLKNSNKETKLWRVIDTLLRSSELGLSTGNYKVMTFFCDDVQRRVHVYCFDRSKDYDYDTTSTKNEIFICDKSSLINNYAQVALIRMIEEEDIDVIRLSKELNQ